MGKKKGLAAIFSKPNKLAAADHGSPSPPWQWPSCATNPQTPSFRRQGSHGDDDRPCTTAGPVVAAAGRLRLPRGDAAGDMYKTVNSVYFDPADTDSCFSFGNGEDGDGDDALVDDCVSFSTTTASEEWSEAVIRSLGRSSTGDRFFFDSGPPPASNSILAASRSPYPSPGRTTLVTQSPRPKQVPVAAIPDTEGDDSDDDAEEGERQLQEAPASSTSPLVEESVAVALDSDDPYRDFRASMEEMVAAHGLRDWPSLQEMLLWYLRINGKHNHALILGAFVDLLVGLATTTGSRSGRAMASAATTTTTTMTSTTTAATTRSSSSSTSSIAGDGATCSSTAATTTTTVDEQCCGGSSGTDDASCSPAAPSSDQEDEDEPVGSDEPALHFKLCT